MSNTEGFEDMSPPKGEDAIEGNEVQYEKALSQKKKMEELQEISSFIFFKELLEKQIEYRIRKMLIMPEGTDDVVKRTYSCGEIAGMKMALDYPGVLISLAEDVMRLTRKRDW